MMLATHVPGSSRRTPVALLGVLAVLVTLALTAAPRPAEAATTAVKVGQLNGGTSSAQQYNSASISVVRGDTVRWEWFNGTHDIQSANAPGLSSGPKDGFNSLGQVYQYTFNTAGTYTYYCDTHAGPGDADLAVVDRRLADGKMVGKIVVTAGSTTTPTATATVSGTATPAATATPTPPPPGGSRSLSTKPIAFPAVSLTGAAQNADAVPQTWRASDTTGTGAGWSVTLTGANFNGASGAILSTNLKVQLLQSNVITVSGNTAPQTQVPAFQPLNPTAPLKLLRASAGTGMGTYDFVPDFSLTVPASTPLGDYAASLVVTINLGP